MLRKKILLAEDDEDDRLFFLNFLQYRNDIALLPIAADGVILMEQLDEMANASDMPDFIILDQNMPRQNGLQTLSIIKNNSRYAHIPVAIYSTYTDEELIKKGAETGACLVTTKPISKDEYDKMVNLFLEACR